jgi:hypothetical protein
LILYDRIEKKYFKVRPDDYKDGRVEAVKYFNTLEIAVNFTFDTYAAPKYKDQEMDKLRLEAEIRITTSVRKAGKELVRAIADKMRLAFERFITDKFEWNWDTQKHIIADGVMIRRDTAEFEVKNRRIKELKDILSLIIKVGAYCRLSDDEPTLIIDEEYTEPEVYGEWVRARDTNYEHRESFIKDFSLDDELSKPLYWSMARHMFAGETGWAQLKRIKAEEE